MSGLVRVATGSPVAGTPLSSSLILTLVFLPEPVTMIYINLGDRVATGGGASLEALSFKGGGVTGARQADAVLLTKVVMATVIVRPPSLGKPLLFMAPNSMLLPTGASAATANVAVSVCGDVAESKA